jgi:histidinol-phosphatase (PHP family)
MKANYHTHTVRCRHASGTEREYIETAISRGLTDLGFSDHCPMPFPNEYRSGHRMDVEEFPEYIETLLALREEYADRIKIHIGLEVEYYPLVFPDFLKLISPYPVDYLILGQHLLGNEFDHKGHSLEPTDSEERLAAYTAQVSEALETGAFSYFAHPDMINFTGDDATYRRHMMPVLRIAKRMNIPVEYNLLGLADNRIYPSRRFFRLAADMGVSVIIGSDAHSPDRVAQPFELLKAYHFLNELCIKPIDELHFRRIPKSI